MAPLGAYHRYNDNKYDFRTDKGTPKSIDILDLYDKKEEMSILSYLPHIR